MNALLSAAPVTADTLVFSPTAPGVGSDSVGTADRRRSRRVIAPQPGWLSGESNDRSARGRDVAVVDLSEHGVGFRDVKPHRAGTTHWLVVSGTRRLSTRIRIVSCRQNSAGSYDVGAMFF